jgi:hypothetical protein
MSEGFNWENKEMLKAIKKYHEVDNCRIIGIEITSNNQIDYLRKMDIGFKFERIIKSKKSDDKYEYGEIGNFTIHGEVWNNSTGYNEESQFYTIKSIDTDILPILRIIGSMNPEDVHLNVSVHIRKDDNPIITYTIYDRRLGKFLYSYDEKRYNAENLEYSTGDN